MENPKSASYSNGFRKEIQISSTPVLVFMILVALVLLALTENISSTGPGKSIMLLRIFLDLIILFGWLTKIQSETFGKHFLILSLSAYILSFAFYENTPELLILLFIPVALSGAMLNPIWGLGTAVALSGILLALGHFIPEFCPILLVGLSLISILGMAGFMFLVYHPVQEISTWLWNHYNLTLEKSADAGQYRLELNQVLEELLHTNRQLSLANEKQLSFRILAEEAQKTKAAFVAKVSHEFRTPLNMIIGLVNLMIETPQIYGRALPKAMLDDLMIIQRNCEHLTSMVNDVLALSQAESGRITLHRENVDLREIIIQSLDVISPLVKKKGLETICFCPDSLPKVYCDGTRIRQVLLNLVSNAARFTENGGVYVTVDDQPTSLLIGVRDTGPGITPEEIELIFDPFFQGSDTRRDRGGTGLGLTISKQFIELHGGKIWVESQLGIGSSFYFNLPKDQPIGPTVTAGRWINERWPWVARDGKTRFSSENIKHPRIALYDPDRVLVDVLDSYKEVLEFSWSETVSQLIEDLKSFPSNLALINASSQETLTSLLETVRQSIRDTPLVGCILPKHAWEDLSQSVVKTMVKPITKSGLVKAIADLPNPPHKILIADDDPEITRLYSRMLGVENDTLEIEIAIDGATALKKMREFHPDLVMLDISMPDVDGFEVLKQKDADPSICSIPVMIISAIDLRYNPLQTKIIVGTMADGIGPAKLVSSAIGLSDLLLKSEMMLDQVHE